MDNQNCNDTLDFLDEELDKRAAEMVIVAHTAADDNIMLANLQKTIAPIRTQLLADVERALSEITNKLLAHAGSGMITFYKQGFYDGMELADKVLAEEGAV